MAKKNPTKAKVARKSAKAMAQKAGGSKRSGRIAGRTAARAVGKGRVKTEDEFKQARAVGTAAGAEAGSYQYGMKFRGGAGGPVKRRKAIKKAAKRGMADKKKVAFYKAGGTSYS